MCRTRWSSHRRPAPRLVPYLRQPRASRPNRAAASASTFRCSRPMASFVMGDRMGGLTYDLAARQGRRLPPSLARPPAPPPPMLHLRHRLQRQAVGEFLRRHRPNRSPQPPEIFSDQSWGHRNWTITVSHELRAYPGGRGSPPSDGYPDPRRCPGHADARPRDPLARPAYGGDRPLSRRRSPDRGAGSPA